MKPRPACLPCILHQGLQVARQASEDEWSQRKVLNAVMRALPDAEWEQSSPAEVLEDAIACARKTLQVREPYAELRAQIQETFASVAQRFRERLAKAADPFALAVTAAAAANLIDELVFARFGRLDPRGVFVAALGAGFTGPGPSQLREVVDTSSSILYLLDNAGEVYFDAILIELLRDMGKTVRVVVRGGGLLYDATLEDARAAGLGDPEPEEPDEPDAETAPAARPPTDDPDTPQPIPSLIELSYGTLGLPNLAARSTDLGAAVEDADLVISKGATNYETWPDINKEVFHLLRVKCEPVAQSLGVRRGSLILHRVRPPEPSPAD